VLSRRPHATIAATTSTVAGIAASTPPPIARVAMTAPIISATKHAAASPVSTGMNIAIAPASSNVPMMYIPVLPRPIAWNPATFCASAVSLPNAEKA
jgi:hypothetical protein